MPIQLITLPHCRPWVLIVSCVRVTLSLHVRIYGRGRDCSSPTDRIWSRCAFPDFDILSEFVLIVILWSIGAYLWILDSFPCIICLLLRCGVLGARSRICLLQCICNFVNLSLFAGGFASGLLSLRDPFWGRHLGYVCPARYPQECPHQQGKARDDCDIGSRGKLRISSRTGITHKHFKLLCFTNSLNYTRDVTGIKVAAVSRVCN